MAWHKLIWLGVFISFISNGMAHVCGQGEAHAEKHLQQTHRSILVVVGAPGEAEFGQAFRVAAERWRAAFSSEDFQLIDGTDSAPSQGKEHRQQILDWISTPVISKPVAVDNVDNKLTESVQEKWLVLIGHGTQDRTAVKFNLKGPDISADEISKAIAKVKSRWLIVDCSSSSGPFINALSGENRIVITATKSGAEQNYTRFGIYFSQAITDPAADLDHDDCVSILEAFLAASNRVAQFYENEGRLASEQALLDDNGDSRGTPAAFYRGARPVKAPANGLKLDGPLASRMIVSHFGQPDLRNDEQRAQYDSLADEVERLRARKKDLPENEYYEELERLLLEIAKANGAL